MTQDLSASFPEWWSRRMQRIWHKTDVYRAIANFEEAGTLKKGDKVHRPYRSALEVNTVGTGGSYKRQELTDVDDYLEITEEKEVTFYIKDADYIQSNYLSDNRAAGYSDDASIKLSNYIDGIVLGEYDNADSTVDDGDLGGTDDLGITLTTSNILKVFGKANKKLDALNIPVKNRWAVISPEFKDILWQYIQGKDTALGDKTGQNGHLGLYGGFKLFLSNALGWSAYLVLATQATDGDTITINGVTLRFKTAIAQAGDMLIGADAEASCNALVAMVNDSEGETASIEGTLYWGLTAANRKLLAQIVATDGAAYVTFKATGHSYVAVSETLNAGADLFTVGKEIQHCLFGQGKPIDVVIQKYPKLEVHHRDGYIGRDFVTWLLAGVKTFEEGADQLVDVMLRSEAY